VWKKKKARTKTEIKIDEGMRRRKAIRREEDSMKEKKTNQ
jgi:hypothetical protein